MAAQTLSRDDLAFGRAVLLATDALEMAVEGAFWLYDSEDEKWRFFLATTLVDRIGSREIYSRLNEALAKKLSKDEARDFAFYIASPTDKLVKDIRKSFKSSAEASEPFDINPTIDGKVSRAYVYRLSTSLDEGGAKRVQRRFRRRMNELATA